MISRSRLHITHLSLLAITLILAPLAINTSAEEHDHEQGSLHDLMEEAGDAFKSLRPALAKSDQNDTALQLTRQLQTIMTASKQLTPDKADTPDKHTEYHRQMALLLSDLYTLEVQLIEGDTAAAKSTFSKLGKTQRAAHKLFK